MHFEQAADEKRIAMYLVCSVSMRKFIAGASPRRIMNSTTEVLSTAYAAKPQVDHPFLKWIIAVTVAVGDSSLALERELQFPRTTLTECSLAEFKSD